MFSFMVSSSRRLHHGNPRLPQQDECRFVLPVVLCNDWCGEFKEKKAEKGTLSIPSELKYNRDWRTLESDIDVYVNDVFYKTIASSVSRISFNVPFIGGATRYNGPYLEPSSHVIIIGCAYQKFEMAKHKFLECRIDLNDHRLVIIDGKLYYDASKTR